ncbi:MAG: aminoacyl-tRNA hydrolase, partial [Chloroflexi bacterium]|nr:aminoacyl-tRNA hydrolase [Chloroflexota bacterium]
MRHKALVADARLPNARVLLAKPQTFMNLSGQAVGPLVRYYHIPLDHLLVLYDDMDLPFGTLRLRPQGGHGGHKGMKSIVDALGSRQFPRLRVGIGRPPGRMDPADYVLQPFRPEEWAQWPEVETRALQAIRMWMEDGIHAAMNWLNQPRPN